MSTIDTRAQVEAAERVLRLAWLIVFGAVVFSVITVTPLVQEVTPDRWDRTAPLLPIVVDAAVVIVVRIDEIIARLGGRPGGWSAALRWLTGALTLALNITHSALTRDWVGVGVHMVAPVLLIVTAEATLTYRRAITAAVARIEQDAADAQERSRAAHREQIEQARADREAEREQAERDRERAERSAREEREHAARVAREEREHAAQIARDQRDYEARAAREAAERETAAEQARAEREQAEREREHARVAREREAAERAAAAEREAAAEAVRAAEDAAERKRTQARERLERALEHGAGPDEQLPEAEARAVIALALRDGVSQRRMAMATGWSAGWVAGRCKELRALEPIPGQITIEDVAA